MSAERPLPLDGIRVLDLTQNVVGQSAGSALADLGVDVISVGRPEPPSQPVTSVGRNKRSILLNFKEPQAREVFFKLLDAADVVVQGFRPGVMDRLGIGYAAASAVAPRIIYCSLTGYGQDGPYRDRAGHDLNVQGVAGMLPLDADGRPSMPTATWADRSGAANLQIAILAALLQRERHGIGQHLDVALTESVLTVPASEGYGQPRIRKLLNGGPPASEAPPSPMARGEYPCYQLYECQDGRFISLGCVERAFWERLCTHLGRPEWGADQLAEGARRTEIFGHLRAIFLARPRDAWLEELLALDLPVGPVNVGREVLDDPQVRAREAVLRVQTTPGHEMWQIGVPFQSTAFKPRIWRGATLAGQDTRAILGELGYAAEEIDALREAGAIGMLPEHALDLVEDRRPDHT